MMRKNVFGLSVASVIIASALASCAAISDPPPSLNGGSPAVTNTPATEPVAAPVVAPTSPPVTELLANCTNGSALLGELSSQRGINELGPFHVAEGGIAVCARCYGLTSTSIHVEIPGVGEFDQPCVADISHIVVTYEFDVRHVDSVTVRGSGENSNLWALAVTVATPGPR